MGVPARKLDAFLAWLAGRQHGAVTRQQILAAGFSRRLIERRIATGALIPIHPGVYLVGHRAVSPLALEAAAILACAPRGGLADDRIPLLAGPTAARICNLPVPNEGPIHVITVGRTRRSLRGVRVGHIKEVAPSEVRRHEGLPLTSPALTILDLADQLDLGRLRAVLNEARVDRLVSDVELRAALKRHPLRTGAGALRRLLETERGPRLTRSEAERLALRAMTAHGLVPDASDYPVGPYRVDFWFAAERVAVEIDGYRYHSTPDRFVTDRRRVAELAARDVQVFPMTWSDVVAPRDAMRRLSQALARRRAR